MKKVILLAIVGCICLLSSAFASERQYSIREIDELRKAVEMRYLWGTTNYDHIRGFSRQYKEEEKVKAVEEMVRTYMSVGKTAKDLYEADKKR